MTIQDKITDALYSGKINIKESDVKSQFRSGVRSEWGGKSDALAEALRTGKVGLKKEEVKPEELKEEAKTSDKKE